MSRNNTGNPIGSGDPRDREDNSKNLDQAMNASGSTWTDRFGNTRKTFKAAENAADAAEAAADTAVNTTIPNAVAAVEDRADTAVDTEIPAQVQRAIDYVDAITEPDTADALSATIAKSALRAEAARDAATVNADAYPDTAAGLDPETGVALGEQFQVVSADGKEIIRYRHDAGPVATEVARYPTEARVQDTEHETEGYRKAGDPLARSSSPDYAYVIKDEEGKIALAIDQDGKVIAEKSKTTSQEIGGESVTEATKILDAALTIEDAQGKAAFIVRQDGTVEVKKLQADNLNVAGDIPRTPGVYTHELNYINNTGQSLGEGSDGAITTTQEYDNVGFPARSTSPSAFLPLTVANTQVTTRGESPMYGMAGFAKELIAAEAGLDYTESTYQLLLCNNGYSGTPIADLAKGGSTGAFERAISQATSGKTIADGLGLSFSFQAVLWTQGERDIIEGTSKADYLAALLQLSEDYNTDGKAATGQYNDIPLICYQTANNGGQASIAQAQLDASRISPRITMATPIYHLSFYDFQHIDAAGSKWLGGYYGLAYKRVVIDRGTWEPLQPIAHAVNGTVVDLIFNKSGLVFDTTHIPLQTNYGFSSVDSGGSPIAISSVALVGRDRLRITLGASATPGTKIRYAHNSATGRSDPFTGGCGNLRDSAGDWLIYQAINKPMHNWCVIFEYEV